MPSRSAICLSGCLLLLALAGAAGAAQTITTPYSFQGSDGAQPNSIIQARDGNFYGTTAYGGGKGSCTQASGASTGCGTVFEWVPGSGGNPGKEYVIYAFSGGATDGGVPAGLVQGKDGNLYGTTAFGGASVNDGKLCIDPNSNDYSSGTTTPVAATCCPPPTGTSDLGGCGTIFQISVPPAAGDAETPTVLKSFHGETSSKTEDDAYPGPMVPGVLNGTPVFFGTALPCAYCGSLFGAGIDSFGSVFSFDPASDTFTSIAIPTASNFAYGYPNAVIQGLQCPSGDANCLYGTTQLSPPNFSCCGGVFVYDPGPSAAGYSDTGCTFPTPSVSSSVRVEGGAELRERPTRVPVGVNTIVRQPGSRFPSDLEWSFTSVPIQLTMGSDGSILGTSPWACFSEGGGGLMSSYNVGPACQTAGYTENATVFQCQPASDYSSFTLNTLYGFTGTGDGGGSTAGLTPDGAGNLYGATAYGTGASNTTVNTLFQLPSSTLQLGSYGNSSLGTGQAPVWMIEASDGSLYGVSPSGGDNQDGAIFRAQPSTALTAPVAVSISPKVLVLGASPVSATLTWSVPNANSMTARQCFAFESGGAGGGSNWSGAPSANAATGYGGTATIKPTAAGQYTYALSCGGMNYGATTLEVDPALSVDTTPLTGLTEEQAGSVQLKADGGIGPYNWTAVASTLPAGLTVDSTGLVHGTPTVSGTFTLSVTVTDSEGTPATVSGQVTLTIASDAPVMTLSATPNTNVVYGQTITLTATATPLPSNAEGYAWTISDGTTALVTNAASNTPNGYTMTTTATVGQHSYVAKIATPLAGFDPGTSNTVSLTVGKAPTTTTLSLSSQNVSVNSSVTFTVTVAGAAGGTPTGSVQFMNGSTVLGTVPLSGGGASYTTSSLAASTYSVTAAYQGDANYQTSTSGSISLVVAAPGYTLSANPSSLTVNAGASVTSTITLTPTGGYSGTINLTCTTTAPYTSCSFNPSALTADGSNKAVTSTFTFSTNVNTTSGLRNDDRPGRPAGPTMLAAGSLAGFVLLMGLRRRITQARRLRLLGIMLVLVATSFVGSLTACGGGGGKTTNTPPPAVTPAGPYSVTVSASAGSGTPQSLVIPITVN